MALKISGSTIIDDSRNIVNAGVVTATLFSGDGSGLSGVGVGTEDSINTSGIITASTISANEFIGTGDKLIFSPSATSFSPISGATDVSLAPTISITFDQPIYAGVGSIFLRNSSGIGTEIEAIGIGSTTQVSISNQTLSITPSVLPILTNIYVVLPQGVVRNSVAGNIASVSSYNFTTVDFQLNSINPTNGATDVGIDTSITLSFSAAPTKGTGTVYLRSGGAGGTEIESFDAASSGQISISGNDWILTPSSNLSYLDTVYTVIPSTAINGYVGLNTDGASSHSFTTKALALGDAYEGGYLICQAASVRWIVAPNTSQVSRTWYLRADSNTRAQQVSGCTGWFVPTKAQIQNPAYTCRTYWDSYTSGPYWSDTEDNSGDAYIMYFSVGSTNSTSKLSALQVRSLRCVAY